MAFPSFSKRTPPKQRVARSVSANESEADAIARSKSVQDYATKPGVKGGPTGDTPMDKLVKFGSRVARKVVKIGNRLTGSNY